MCQQHFMWIMNNLFMDMLDKGVIVFLEFANIQYHSGGAF